MPAPPSRTPPALGAFVLSLLAIAAAYASAFLPGGAPAWAPWMLAAGTAGTLVAAMALGARRPGRPLGALAWAFAATFVVVAGGFALALALPAEGEPLVLGLPRRAAVLLFGIGLLPLLYLPIAYALTFDRLTLSAEDLADVRARIADAQRDMRNDVHRDLQRSTGSDGAS